jgi:hypothetical protein
VIAGITATQGGVTFAGDTSGLLYVLRTNDGKLLRKPAAQSATAPRGKAVQGRNLRASH